MSTNIAYPVLHHLSASSTGFSNPAPGIYEWRGSSALSNFRYVGLNSYTIASGNLFNVNDNMRYFLLENVTHPYQHVVDLYGELDGPGRYTLPQIVNAINSGLGGSSFNVTITGEGRTCYVGDGGVGDVFRLPANLKIPYAVHVILGFPSKGTPGDTGQLYYQSEPRGNGQALFPPQAMDVSAGLTRCYIFLRGFNNEGRLSAGIPAAPDGFEKQNLIAIVAFNFENDVTQSTNSSASTNVTIADSLQRPFPMYNQDITHIGLFALSANLGGSHFWMPISLGSQGSLEFYIK